MENLFNNILANVSADLSVSSAVITMLIAVVFGGAIAYTYYKTQEENYQRSMAITLLMLPIILSVIILFVGSNIARAFSLAGTLSIIRFRSAPGDPKDIGFIFFDIAAENLSFLKRNRCRKHLKSQSPKILTIRVHLTKS